MQRVPQHMLSRVISMDWFGSLGLLPAGLALWALLSGLRPAGNLDRSEHRVLHVPLPARPRRPADPQRGLTAGEPRLPRMQSGCPDSNWGPLRPERSALPGCATPRDGPKSSRFRHRSVTSCRLCCLHRQREGSADEQRDLDRKPDDGRRAAGVRPGEASGDVRARSRPRWEGQRDRLLQRLGLGPPGPGLRRLSRQGPEDRTRRTSEVPDVGGRGKETKRRRGRRVSRGVPLRRRQVQVRRWCRSRPPSPRKSSIARSHASGRSPISRCPQPGITRSRARRRRVYSNASSSGN